MTVVLMGGLALMACAIVLLAIEARGWKHTASDWRKVAEEWRALAIERGAMVESAMGTLRTLRLAGARRTERRES